MAKNVEAKQENGKLSWPVRLSYAGGDVACNVVFGMVGTLLTLFYTDYVGINPATVGLIMLLSRVFDGASDMVMGIMDPLDERTVCIIGHSFIYRAAYDGNGPGSLYFCNL